MVTKFLKVLTMRRCILNYWPFSKQHTHEKKKYSLSYSNKGALLQFKKRYKPTSSYNKQSRVFYMVETERNGSKLHKFLFCDMFPRYFLELEGNKKYWRKNKFLSRYGIYWEERQKKLAENFTNTNFTLIITFKCPIISFTARAL